MERRHARQSPTRPLVLVVDGHDDMWPLYALGLSAMGFEVVPASDSEEACHQASLMHPDVIVTEVSHPRIDGWSFVHSLKHDPRTRDIPVVVLTALDQASVLERAESEGCAALFITPCLPAELALGLRELLARTGSLEHTSVRL